MKWSKLEGWEIRYTLNKRYFFAQNTTCQVSGIREDREPFKA